MAFLRARQRVITGLTPHQGNKRFIIPKRGKNNLRTIPGTTAFWDFAANQDLADNISGTLLTYSRSTPAWDYDNAGNLVEFAINAPRFGWRVGDALPLGLGVDQASTNDLLASQDIEQAAWVASGGAIKSSPTRVQFGAFDTALLVQSTGAIHGIGANVTYTFGVTLNHDNGVADGTISILLQDGTNAAGEVEQVIAIAETKARQYVTITIPVTTADFITVTMLRRSGDTGAPINVVDWQLEALPFPTSPIVTVAAPVLRANEICRTLDLSWYPQGAGTAYAKTVHTVDSTNNTSYMYQLSDNSNSNRIGVAANTQHRSVFSSRRTDANGGSGTSATDSWGAGQISKHAAGWDAVAGNLGIYMNGAQVSVGGDTVDFGAGMTDLNMGSQWNEGNFLNGHCLQWGFNENRLPDNVLQAITQ